jgi:transposase-like protein
MTDTPTSADIAEQQKTAAAFVGTVFNTGAEPLLKAQAEILESVESSVTGWLHRRHEGVADTKLLVERLRASSDPAEILKAQQEWVTGAFRRLAADAAAAQAATLHLVERSQGWIKQGSEAAESVAPHAAEAARAAMKPVRMSRAAE